MPKTTKIIISVVVVAFLAWAGWLYSVSKQNPGTKAIETLPMENKSSPPEALKTPQSEQLETAQWKTYRNTKLGFEFSYPKDAMTLREVETLENPGQLLYLEFGGGMLFQGEIKVEKTNIKNIKEYRTKSEIEDIKEQHYTTLAGEQARITTFLLSEPENEGLAAGIEGSEKDIYAEVIHDGKVFSLLLLDRKGNDFSDTVLSTLKFLKGNN